MQYSGKGEKTFCACRALEMEIHVTSGSVDIDHTREYNYVQTISQAMVSVVFKQEF